MNTCIKCGCQDAYPSLPPCPTPAACPNPQPCSEVFDAQCIVFTLPDIECGLDIVVAQDSSVAEALDSIVSFFCEEIFGLVQSVTGLNTDNTDPRNPIIRISVDGTTITGLGTPASPLVATSTPYTLPIASPTVLGGIKVGTGLSIDGSGVLSSTSSITGSGTTDYVTRWTPNGTTLGIGVIRDNGTTVGIGTAPQAGSNLYVTSIVGGVTGVTNTSGYQGIVGASNGAGVGTNSGVKGSASFGAVNIGTESLAVSALGTTAIGGSFTVAGLGTNYGIKVIDGTQGINKVLTDVTGNGDAHWVTPSGGVSGSGINDYIARWTPDGSTLGTGVIRDNGTTIGISNNPISTAKVSIISAVTTGISLLNNYLGTNATGINITVTGANSFSNEGIVANAQNSTGNNRGVRGIANSTVGTNIGLSGAAVNGPVNYAIELIDGTEGIGKVLTCVTSDGKAHWATPATPPGAMTWTTLFGISPSALMLPNNGYIIRDTVGAGTLLTLPVYGTCSIGDKIEIIAAGATPATLSNWSIDPGQLGDTIYASFSVPSGFDILEQTFTTGGLGLPINFTGAVVGAANCRKVSMTLVCIKDNGSSYIWQLTTATNYNLVP